MSRNAAASLASLLSLAEASRKLGLPARALSDAIYTGRVDASLWPVVGGRVLVPADALPKLAETLSRDRRRTTSKE